MNYDNLTRAKLSAMLRKQTLDFEQYKAQHPVANMWRRVIDQSPISIQVLDKNGFSVSVNEAHTRFFEAKPPPGYNLFTDDQLLKQGLADCFERLKQGRAVFFPETRYNARENNPEFPDKTVWLKTIGLPMLNEAGQPVIYVVIHENITEQKKTKEELQQKYQELGEAIRQKEESREKERAEISDEIHDELAQVLTVVKVSVGRISEKISDASLKSDVDAVFWQLDGAIESVHRILTSLYDTKFEEYGIQRAIESYCRDFKNKSGIEVETLIAPGLQLPPQLPMSIYRILKEAMTNIIRHAKANKAMVTLKMVGSGLYFSVADDGIGITSEQINSAVSLGINSMKERIAALGGTFEISSGKKSGTQINIIVPL